MSDIATEPPASPANTVVLSMIDAHGSRFDAWVIQHVATNAANVAMATTALTKGSSCAAAINGNRKNAFLITSDVQSSGAVRPVSTEITDTTVTSAASTTSVTGLRVTAT